MTLAFILQAFSKPSGKNGTRTVSVIVYFAQSVDMEQPQLVTDQIQVAMMEAAQDARSFSVLWSWMKRMNKRKRSG
jgi:hypothetical protein